VIVTVGLGEFVGVAEATGLFVNVLVTLGVGVGVGETLNVGEGVKLGETVGVFVGVQAMPSVVGNEFSARVLILHSSMYACWSPPNSTEFVKGNTPLVAEVHWSEFATYRLSQVFPEPS
jgi:hypothetical protein